MMRASKKVFLAAGLLTFSLILLPLMLLAGCSSSQSQSTSTPAQGSAPQVVSTSPKAGDVHVAPATDTLTVTFDQPMLADSYSFVENTSKGQFPEVIGKPVISGDQKTFTAKIRLQPRTNYYISINDTGHTDFRSKDGGTPATPYVIEFQTN